ncbi:MAG: methyltransferase [Actinomycetota bacterium]|nr:methyltransferase [Actinomycetota bacterium]
MISKSRSPGRQSKPSLADPASFRDPSTRVFHNGGRILRTLRGQAADDWSRLASSELLRRLIDRGALIPTREVRTGELAAGDRPVAEGDAWSLLLEHERVPFVSYPYEWSFSMLQDAAALHLEVLLEALSEGMTLKDGSAFNVQWMGTAPVFIDVGSFEPTKGAPWAGYRQFCQTFLYPLFLQSYSGVPYQPFLRGQVEGFTPAQMRRLIAARLWFRAGVFKHVVLHDALQRRFPNDAQATVSRLRDAGFNDQLTARMAKSLLRLVRRLGSRRRPSHWLDYARTCTYTDAERAAKAEVVRRGLVGPAGRVVLDLGCNDGTYSRMAAEAGAFVIAVDSDEEVVDNLYKAVRREGRGRILPLVVDVADPSPGIGWRGRERLGFFERTSPDVVLCLALIHHLVIGRNIPLVQVVDWLRSLDARVVVEFVDRDDHMAKRLLANKPAGIHDDYRIELFERELGRCFRIRERAPLHTRTLFTADPK